MTILKEYSKGNYVISGGAWNENLLPYDSTAIIDDNKAKCIHAGIPSGFLPAGLQLAYDPSNATTRM